MEHAVISMYYFRKRPWQCGNWKKCSVSQGHFKKQSLIIPPFPSEKRIRRWGLSPTVYWYLGLKAVLFFSHTLIAHTMQNLSQHECTHRIIINQVNVQWYQNSSSKKNIFRWIFGNCANPWYPPNMNTTYCEWWRHSKSMRSPDFASASSLF